ncbi:MAG: hypothetical protein AVDCRST_MAG65-965 [uncultured Solirubrobacteraceae bacterium]|uniref:Roadblock/LAMTOR2 domain-containing protein n=1 Tax=uncultured Solirubrobacteraceae bacterium TaxID=1162706 RepID=A0A6J4RHV1_9ACTN|nr:MAG: hypothetical protein AVDCRST_MAG65-965 [uncultured Solirubrobacteraceae bacterium]
MDAPLTPDLALAYLVELSLDLKAAIVVDGDGRRRAGAPELLEPARAVLEVPAAVAGLVISTSAGYVVGCRSHAAGIVVATGPLALPGLVLHDVGHVVALLGGGRAVQPSGDAARPAPSTLTGLGEAVQSAVASVATLSSGDR